MKKIVALKYTIYLVGFCSLVLYALAFGKFHNLDLIHPEVFEKSTLCQLSKFSCKVPKKWQKFRETEKNSDPNQANVLLFSDSFFDFEWQKTFPEILADTLGIKVFYERSRTPLNELRKIKLKKGEKRYLVFELSEANINTVFGKNHIPFIPKRQSKIYRSLQKVFPPTHNTSIEYLLSKSKLTYKPYTLFLDSRFNVFKTLPPETPFFSENPPAVFHFSALVPKPGGFYYQQTENELNYIVDQMQKFATTLKTKYNLELILVIVPTKYTVEHKLINQHQYSNFLPQLLHKLSLANIEHLKLYDSFINASNELYHPFDIHWNANGVKLTMDIFLEKYGQKLKSIE